MPTQPGDWPWTRASAAYGHYLPMAFCPRTRRTHNHRPGGKSPPFGSARFADRSAMSDHVHMKGIVHAFRQEHLEERAGLLGSGLGRNKAQTTGDPMKHVYLQAWSACPTRTTARRPRFWGQPLVERGKYARASSRLIEARTRRSSAPFCCLICRRTCCMRGAFMFAPAPQCEWRQPRPPDWRLRTSAQLGSAGGACHTLARSYGPRCSERGWSAPVRRADRGVLRARARHSGLTASDGCGKALALRSVVPSVTICPCLAR